MKTAFVLFPQLPTNLKYVTASSAAGSPLYLSMVAAYLNASVLLGVQPVSLLHLLLLYSRYRPQKVLGP